MVLDRLKDLGGTSVVHLERVLNLMMRHLDIFSLSISLYGLNTEACFAGFFCDGDNRCS